MEEFLLQLIRDVNANKIEVLRERLILEKSILIDRKTIPCSCSSPEFVVDTLTEPWLCHGRMTIPFSCAEIQPPDKRRHIYPWPSSTRHRTHRALSPTLCDSQHGTCESPRIEQRHVSVVPPHVRSIPSQICLARQHGIRRRSIELSTSSMKHFRGIRGSSWECRRHSKS